MRNDSCCICCGAPVPEGRQVCPECEGGVNREPDPAGIVSEKR